MSLLTFLNNLVQLILNPQIQFHLLQERLLSIIDILTRSSLKPSQRSLLLIFLIVLFIFMILLFITIGRDETVLVTLVQDVVSEKNTELVASNPWALRHVVNVTGLNLWYMYMKLLH